MFTTNPWKWQCFPWAERALCHFVGYHVLQGYTSGHRKNKQMSAHVQSYIEGTMGFSCHQIGVQESYLAICWNTHPPLGRCKHFFPATANITPLPIVVGTSDIYRRCTIPTHPTQNHLVQHKKHQLTFSEARMNVTQLAYRMNVSRLWAVASGKVY